MCLMESTSQGCSLWWQCGDSAGYREVTRRQGHHLEAISPSLVRETVVELLQWQRSEGQAPAQGWRGPGPQCSGLSAVMNQGGHCFGVGNQLSAWLASWALSREEKVPTGSVSLETWRRWEERQAQHIMGCVPSAWVTAESSAHDTGGQQSCGPWGMVTGGNKDFCALSGGHWKYGPGVHRGREQNKTTFLGEKSQLHMCKVVKNQNTGFKSSSGSILGECCIGMDGPCGDALWR